MITSLVQVVNKRAANRLSRRFIYKLDASRSQTCCNLMNSTDLLQLVDNLQQAGKIHNLQQICGVSGCVQDGNFTSIIFLNELEKITFNIGKFA